MSYPHKKVVDLRKCVPGQKLRTIHGTIVIYVRPLPAGNYYDHEIRYPDGALGTRIHDGHVYRNVRSRLPADEDIIEILPVEKPSRKKR